MVLCALALIGGGTGLSSTRGVRQGTDREAPRGVMARSIPGISVGTRVPIRQEMTVPLTLAMAGG
jgi:hypothetical protein